MVTASARGVSFVAGSSSSTRRSTAPSVTFSAGTPPSLVRLAQSARPPARRGHSRQASQGAVQGPRPGVTATTRPRPTAWKAINGSPRSVCTATSAPGWSRVTAWASTAGQPVSSPGANGSGNTCCTAMRPRSMRARWVSSPERITRGSSAAWFTRSTPPAGSPTRRCRPATSASGPTASARISMRACTSRSRSPAIGASSTKPSVTSTSRRRPRPARSSSARAASSAGTRLVPPFGLAGHGRASATVPAAAGPSGTSTRGATSKTSSPSASRSCSVRAVSSTARWAS